MRFYDREIEIKTLRNIEKLSYEYAQFTVITGRRRIGKTTLIKHAYDTDKIIYFFIARKSEGLICNELSNLIMDHIGEELGTFTSMRQLFVAIMQIAKRKHLTIVFDEFQNFKYVNESFFSEMQNIWDSNKDEAKINLIVCGSLYSMMTKIFDDRKEPLYGRATSRLRLKEFPLHTIKEIMEEHNPNYAPDDLLAMYMITGGVAKYVEQLSMYKAFTKEDIINSVLSYGSYFIDEGRELLSNEFGKDYGNYFSILSAVASGFNKRGEIKSYTGIEAGGYLEKLEKVYDIVYKYRPYLSSENSRSVKYGIKDNFLNFWFRFVYKYRSAVEIGNLDYVKDKVIADYETFSGWILERYFRQKYRETGMYNIVTNYWEKGGMNEIDIVAANDVDRKLVIAECKRNPNRVNLNILKNKAINIVQKRKNWHVDYIGLSLNDM